MPLPSSSVKSQVFANAFWIWPESHHWDLHNSYALFRKEFTIAQVPKRAALFITADQAYNLYINGAFVCRGPARGFQAHWPYDEIDVHQYLKKGANSIAVRAYNPGYSNFQYISQGFAGLLLAASWGNLKINSDKTWKSLRQQGISRDTAPTSVQLFNQEHVDLRKEPGDWTALDFDDSSWLAPEQIRWNGAPWFSLEPRNIPMLAEVDMQPVRLIGENQGASALPYKNVRDVVVLRSQEDRSHRPSQAGFQPLQIRATGEGKFRSYLFDFGKTVVGNLTLDLEGTRGGEMVDTSYYETINENNLTPDWVMPVGSRIALGDRLICHEGKSHHRFFHPYGFRYLCLTVRDSLHPLQLRLTLNWIGYPLERKGLFKSSEKDLQDIWETCAWTQQCCSLDAYVDTPWREQAQWWGDARVQASNTFHLSGDVRLLRRGIAQIAAQSTPDGITYGHAPTMAHSCILPDFTLIWILTLWDYYWQTDSIEPFLAHQETIEKALNYFRNHTDPRSGLITFDERYWLFLDWSDLFKDGAPTIYNLWLLLALDKLVLLYRKAKRPKAATPLHAWSNKLRTALQPLINSEGLIRDGVDRKGKIVPTTSVHAQTLALAAKLKGMNSRVALDTILLPFIRGEFQPKAVPSSYWVTYVFSALIEQGYGDEVIRFIHRNWLPMVAHGTTWENYTVAPGDTSCSHAWSAHPLYHLMQTIGGIRQTGPAWSKIIFHPTFHGASGESKIPTPAGFIHSRWNKMSDGMAEVSLRLPAGIQARVELPGLAAQEIKAGGKWRVPCS